MKRVSDFKATAAQADIWGSAPTGAFTFLIVLIVTRYRGKKGVFLKV